METQKGVPADTLIRRIRSFQDWGRQNGFDAVVVFGQGSALGTATRSHGNLRYLLDWDADAAASALVLPADGKPSLVVANIFAQMRGRERSILADVRFGRGPSFANAVLELLPADAKRVALAGRDEIPLGIWEPLASLGAGGWIGCDAELARRRAIKDGLQIEYHRKAAAVCDRLFDSLGPLLHAGLTVAGIQAELEKIGHQQGCEYCKTWLTVRPIADRCRYLAEENTNLPRAGDQALLGIMLTLRGHWGHAIRTGSLGSPGATAQKIFHVVEDMHKKMIESLRPGADLNVVGRHGLVSDSLGPCFQFRGGHALGYSYEDPVGSAEFPQPYDPAAKAPSQSRTIQPGMLFEIHPNLFVKNVAGASIGDMVLVTEVGPEILTRHPRQLLQY
ncbi:MAG TPA: M24 family metallopeptidase [Xanthobacteraceae bacterium]|nr:M24 family metallopeptidase [Xanthobacteraceae bacterium]